ncbi:MAG: hypothetical protein B7X58_14725, partial [Marinobacter sp. 34-60-7]
MESPFYPDASRQHALETLRHLCGFGDMALVVTGAPGAGKTRILAELIRSESSRLAFHRVPASALTSTQALARDLRRIAQTSLSPEADARETVHEFFRWSERQGQRGRRQVLLMDDADKASADVIALVLSAFVAANRSMAATPVFAGSDELTEELMSRAEARMSASCMVVSTPRVESAPAPMKV